ncbi:amino acid ABC transporter substrate-binding protein [Campylobacterota bacterium]|nr:amino acid ABC transporter substrate-binding protein [Campylobacterota bacterium]
MRSVLVFLAIVCLAFGARNNPSSVSEIKERGVLRVAVYTDMPPFGYLDANGRNQGYDIYFARRFAKELLGDENKIEFVSVNPAARFDILLSGKADMLLAILTVTDERKKIVDFASPYLRTAIGVISPRSGFVRNAEQLAGKKLIVIEGTTADHYFTDNYPEIIVQRYADHADAFGALEAGDGDAMASDRAMLATYTATHPDFFLGIATIGKPLPIAPAVRKGNRELRDWINATLFKLGKENFAHKAYEATLKPFLGTDISADDFVVEGGMF